jgi:hypothetical protein
LATFQHPAPLNALQQFRQACSILRNTTRASNPAWYQHALELNFQLHIRLDGVGITTFYHDSKKAEWNNGPLLSEEILQDPTRLDTFAAEALRAARSHGATSLGVILHVADEFATTELKPEFDHSSDLSDLRNTAISNPGSILEDSSILADQASWRVLPYPAAGSQVIGTAITISKHHAPLIAKLRETGDAENFPIITHALSAPLVAIMGLSQSIEPTPGKPFVGILQYPWFTVLAFFNEQADLQLVRTLQHRGLRRPTNFRNSLTTTNASLEFVDPDLFLLPLGEKVDASLGADLQMAFITSRLEVVQSPRTDAIPAWCPELSTSAQPAAATTHFISHTFTILHEEKWALQDFLPTPQEILEIYPSRSEMRLLKLCRLSRVALFAIAVLCIAYFGFGMIELIRHPAWTFNPKEAATTKEWLANLNTERQKGEHWNNLLEDRSKAWTSMESLSRMFPENRGMLVNTYTHAAKPDSATGKTKTKTNTKVGIVKEWKITGYARDQALGYLNTLNTREGISAHFSEIARITGSTAFSPTLNTRNLVVNVRTQENNAYRNIPPEEINDADESTYAFTFDLTITQRFEATDPMAITTAKAP